jgi:hypothetical protein
MKEQISAENTLRLEKWLHEPSFKVHPALWKTSSMEQKTKMVSCTDPKSEAVKSHYFRANNCESGQNPGCVLCNQ